MPDGAYTTLVGNLTRDPELRFTSTGTAVAHFSIAVNRRGFEGRPDTVSYFDCVAWQKLGEHVAETLQRGHRVIVFGRMENRAWQKEDGGKGSRWEVTADACGPDLRFQPLDMPQRSPRPKAPDLQPVPEHPAGSGFGTSEDPF
jgi:single-strand DNA-binding protein